mmetsp:Transcript_20159/g.32587  ORF Transcript_20159/g.32587 Transcript_20159/m.32587 type:complete len:85 (+) Transcript_20159:130-384(+)
MEPCPRIELRATLNFPFNELAATAEAELFDNRDTSDTFDSERFFPAFEKECSTSDTFDSERFFTIFDKESSLPSERGVALSITE